jgi:raffinose/stachyose/melibiose transport system substrate-binding protein
MKTAKFVLLALLIGVMLVIVSASYAQSKTVTMWAADNEDGECWASVVKENFSNPDIQIEVVMQPALEMIDASRTALQGGAGPDIVQTHGPSFTLELVEAGLLAPLDAYAEQYGWSERFAPWALNVGKVNDQLYGLSSELETMVMWYNKTLFEGNGWQIPVTFEELFALAQQIQDAGIIPFGPAMAAECAPCLEWYVGVFLNHYAGADKVYEALTGQRPWTDPAFIEAITQLNEMMQKGWLAGGKDFFFSDTFDTTHAMFGNGEIAMNFEGTWFGNSITDFFGEAAGNSNDWDWFAIPTTFTSDPFYMIGAGSSYSLNANAADKDAAAEVLDSLFSTDTQAKIFEKCGYAPAPLNYEGDVFANSDPRIARIYSSFGEASAKGNVGYTTWSFWPAKTDVYLYEGMAQVYDGQLSVEDYLAEMDRIFQEEFAAGEIPPIPSRG